MTFLILTLPFTLGIVGNLIGYGIYKAWHLVQWLEHPR
jgi:hypothetical protein